MNSESVFIRSEPLARKYELSFDEKRCSFQIRTKKEYIDLYSNPNLQENIRERQDELNLGEWHFDSPDRFGYSDCFCKNESEGMLLLQAPLTLKNGTAIAATLGDLFPILEHIAEDKPATRLDDEQEMLIETGYSAKPQVYGGAMKADLSKNFTLWLYNQNDRLRNQVNPKVRRAIVGAFKILFEQKPKGAVGGLDDHGFLLYPPLAIYSCQFGIDSQSRVDFKQEQQMGYTTFCHNLDTWKQQLVLLAGFAVICEAFRNASIKKS